jgi:hypothetical protein
LTLTQASIGEEMHDWEAGREFAKDHLGGKVRHAIGQVGMPTPLAQPPFVTLCEGIQTPSPEVETAESCIFVTCGKCAERLLASGCGTAWNAEDPRTVIALRRAAARQEVTK